jgi:predicted enzyme related to lactoylglutathione lyase
MGRPVVHFEILGKDADKTQRYYAELFGWEIEDLPFDNPTKYGIVDREKNTNGDGVGINGGVGQAPEGYDGHVTFYVEVPDVEAALSDAERLGGSRMMGPDQVPGGPVIGLFQDPDGNTVGVVKAD